MPKAKKPPKPRNPAARALRGLWQRIVPNKKKTAAKKTGRWRQSGDNGG